MAVQYGEAAAWAREAGYDGLQLASSNAKLIDQLLSPFWNRRDDEFGGSLERRARVLRAHPRAHRRARRRRLHRHREGAGGGEGPAVHPPHHLGRGHRAVPAGGGLRLRLGHTGRGVGVPRHDALAGRHPDVDLEEQGDAEAVPRRPRPGASSGPCSPPATCSAAPPPGSSPVWNRSRFVATKAAVSIPVLAVGRHPRRPRGRRDPRRRAGRPGRHRPALLRRARPARAHPRRPARARASASTRTSACRPRCSA